MLKTLKAVLMGRATKLKQHIEIGQADTVIEGKIVEAENGQTQAKRALASMITRTKNEGRALAGIEKRVQDLESRIKMALRDGQDELAADAAQMLASMENERKVRQETLRRSDEKAQRLRLAIEKNHRMLIDLRQGLIMAKAITTERKAFGSLQGDLNARSSIREGEAVLQRLLDSEDPVEAMEILDDIEDALSGDKVLGDLAEAGYGASLKTNADDVLTRIKAEIVAEQN